MLQSTQGYLFPVHGSIPRVRTVSYDALGPKTLHDHLPAISPTAIFNPAPPFEPGTRRIVDTTVVLIGKERFLVLSYKFNKAEKDRPINESLAALTGNPTWEGELAIFPLGTIVPYLSRPRVRRAVIEKAAIA